MESSRVHDLGSLRNGRLLLLLFWIKDTKGFSESMDAYEKKRYMVA